MHAPAPRFPFGTGAGLDIDPGYAALGAGDSPARVTMPFGGEAWLATRHADVKFVLSDRRFSRSESVLPDKPRFWEQLGLDGIGYQDPPDHSRLRRLVTKAFSVRRVEEFRPRVHEIVGSLLDDLAGETPPVDLVQAYALRVPGVVICEFLGVPYEDRDRFEPFFDVVVATDAVPVDEIIKARQQLENYFSELIERERRTPTDGLFGALVRVRDNEDKLSEKELVEFGFGLIVAGHETTGSEISNFLLTLLRHPRQMAKLRDDPGLVPQAVEELLRYVPLLTIGGIPFAAKEDVQVGGVLVRAGEIVIPSLEAANRDGDVFPDPHSLDITRTDNGHVTFSHGIHHCLGAQLARVELQSAVAGLLRRFPGIRLAVPETEIEWKTGLVVRGPKALPVTW